MKKRLVFMFLAIALLFTAAACGPAAAPQPASGTEAEAEGEPASQDSPSEAGEDEDTGANPVETEAETSAAQDPEANEIQAIGEEEMDAQGIPVGFTAEGRPYRGSLDAAIVMEEFSDYQCPFCKRFTEQTLPELVQNQVAAGDVLLIYYDFPLESIHPQAFAAANAARCAGEQSAAAYWEMHDLLYGRMQEWSNNNAEQVFNELASELNLDAQQFAACVSEMKYAEQVQEDIDFGMERGVRSTPSFFLNDQLFVGAQPLPAFNQAIAMIQEGESIAQEEPPAPEPESPLVPPPVKPTPAAIAADSFAATMGNPDAPVTIVEFTDYQCPFCQQHALETLPLLISEKIDSGDIYYMLKDLPLDGIHPNARSAAVAARCAGEQDAYWEMHDALFESQDLWAAEQENPQTVYADLAADLDLDLDAFEICLDNPAHADAVQENVVEATNLGIGSTPYFFINGYPLSGAREYEVFEFASGLAAEGTLAEAYVPPPLQLEGAYAIGDPDAPVTIVEFTDFQCPFCSRHFTETYTKIRENYVDTGKVYYVFKDFPLTSIHPQAVKAAEAARCAGEQDAYVDMHDRLFSEQAAWSNNPDAESVFQGFAEELGLQTETFNECLSSGIQEAAVLADFQEGARRGINGTPAFYINEHSLSGAQPYAVFEQAIEQFLNETG